MAASRGPARDDAGTDEFDAAVQAKVAAIQAAVTSVLGDVGGADPTNLVLGVALTLLGLGVLLFLCRSRGSGKGDKEHDSGDEGSGRRGKGGKGGKGGVRRRGRAQSGGGGAAAGAGAPAPAPSVSLAAAKAMAKKTRNQRGQSAVERHPAIIHTLKGHTEPLTAVAFSPNGKLIVTASRDRSAHVYVRAALASGSNDGRMFKFDMDYDVATAVSFTGDSHYAAFATEREKRVRFFAVSAKAKPELKVQFPIAEHTSDVHTVLTPNFHLLPNSVFVVTVAGESDTKMRVWTRRGESVTVCNTNQMQNFGAAASPDGKLLLAATWRQEVQVWAVAMSKAGEVEGARKCGTLHGHKKTVTGAAFCGTNSSRAYTCSHDGTWRVWDVAVRYHVQEDPHLMFTHEEPDAGELTRIAVSNAGDAVAVVSASHLLVYAVRGIDPENRSSDIRATRVLSVELDNAVDGPVVSMAFAPAGDALVTAHAFCKHARVWGVPAAE